MKSTKLFFILCIVFSCTLLSCQSYLPSKKEIESYARELATYLTDNYPIVINADWRYIGLDTLYFQNEVGEVQPFVLVHNSFEEAVVEREKVFPSQRPDTITYGFTMHTSLNYRNADKLVEAFFVEINHGYGFGDSYDEVGTTMQLYATSIGQYLDCTYQINDDYISIKCANMKCTLKKNTGIIQFTIGEQSWDLIQ